MISIQSPLVRLSCFILFLTVCNGSSSSHQQLPAFDPKPSVLLGQLLLASNDITGQTKQPVIHFAIGFSLAPYMLKNSRGIVGEIISEAVASSGSVAKFHYMTNKAALEAFENGTVEAVAVVRPGMTEGYYSENIVTFNNYAIGLASNSEKILQIEDLKGYSIAAFSNAKKYLGEDFAAAADKANYEEIADQKLQAKALLTGKVDLIIADKLIFEFNKSLLINEFTFDKTYRQKVHYYPLFTPTHYYAAFKSKETADQFNRGFKQVIVNGTVERIFQKYTDLLKNY